MKKQIKTRKTGTYKERYGIDRVKKCYHPGRTARQQGAKERLLIRQAKLEESGKELSEASKRDLKALKAKLGT